MNKNKVLANYKDIPLPPSTEGVVLETSLSHYVAPEGCFSFAENLHNDTIGQMTSRRPIKQASGSFTNNILSATLYQATGSSYQPYWIVQDGTGMSYDVVNGASQTTVAGVFASSNIQRFDNLGGYILMTNGSGQPKYFNVSPTSTPTALGTSFPTTNNLISAGFIGRIWSASTTDANNNVYYSDPLTGVITAATGGASAIRINANLGDTITGFVRTQNVLYVFTSNGIFRVYNTQSVDNSPIYPVGAVSQEAIVKAKDGYYFYHTSGVYRLSENSKPVEISQRVRGIISSVRTSEQPLVIGWSDDDHVYFRLGKNLYGYDTNKCWVIRYTISTQVWSVYSFYDFYITAATYNQLNTIGSGSYSEDIFPMTYLFGYQISSPTTRKFGTMDNFTPDTVDTGIWLDFGTFPVFIKQISHWNIFGMEAHIKRINGIAFPHENGGGLTLSYTTDKDTSNSYRFIGTLNDNYISLFQDFQSDAFNRVKIQVSGVANSQVRIGRPILLGLDDLGYRNN